jgi:hypothetical protein
MQAWCKRHLGIDVGPGGAAFTWADIDGKRVTGTTAWLIDPESDHFIRLGSLHGQLPVADLHALVKALKEEGCNVLRS